MIRSRLSILCAQLVTQQREVLHLLEDPVEWGHR